MSDVQRPFDQMLRDVEPSFVGIDLARGRDQTRYEFSFQKDDATTVAFTIDCAHDSCTFPCQRCVGFLREQARKEGIHFV